MHELPLGDGEESSPSPQSEETGEQE